MMNSDRLCVLAVALLRVLAVALAMVALAVLTAMVVPYPGRPWGNRDQFFVFVVQFAVIVVVVLLAVTVVLGVALRQTIKWLRFRRGDGRETMMASARLRVVAVALSVVLAVAVAVAVGLYAVALDVTLSEIFWTIQELCCSPPLR
jgi:hypothetical protein